MKDKKHSRGKKKRQTRQLVASTTTSILDVNGGKSERGRITRSNVKNVTSSIDEADSVSCSNQTDYFAPTNTSTKETQTTQTNRSDTSRIMINVPRLLSQLLNARVVLNRIETTIETPTKSPTIKRYCCICKILDDDGQGLSNNEFCRKCDNLLIFVCAKCNKRFSTEYRKMKKHFEKCKGQGDTINMDELASIALIRCSNCSFVCIHPNAMNKHVKHTGHSTLDDGRTVQDTQEKSSPTSFLVKQNSLSMKKAIKRYCPKCKEYVVDRRAIHESTCQICKSSLLYRCNKCNFQRDYYKALYYHVKTRCYANIYQCPKCKYIAFFWNQMYAHLSKTSICSGVSNFPKIDTTLKNKQ